jgi:RNA polymerase sigma-70 factor, ECF subfamily
MSDTTADLFKRARAGDMDAFAEVFESVRPSLYAVAYRLVGPDDVDDVVMETYLKAWQALPRFRGGASLKTWLYRIAHNCGVDIVRRRARKKEQALPEGEGGEDGWAKIPDSRQAGPDEMAVKAESAAMVRAALVQLPEEHRTALLLRFAEDLSCREIAAATGVSVGTVLSRLFYGKRKLQKIMERSDAGATDHA